MRGVKQLVIKLVQSVLFWQAQMVRLRTIGPVIAIVGSVGKTSTKDALGIVVRRAKGNGNYVISPKSFNAELGIPLTILGFKHLPKGLGWISALLKGQLIAYFGIAPKAMVVELGEENPGDLATFARLVRPTHLIITELSEAHSASMGSRQAIEKELLSPIVFLASDGVLIVNGDNPVLGKLTVAPTQTKIEVRISGRADYFATGIKIGIEGTHAVIHHGNRTQKVMLKRWGEHQVYSALFMAAMADLFGLTVRQQLECFKSLKASPGRGMLLDGKKGSLILDESYNASPAAMIAALETLKHLPAKKRVAILGDMRELENPALHHDRIGKLARETADYLIAVGPESRRYRADEWFDTASKAGTAALRHLAPGVIVLVKGSQNRIRLERAVKLLMAYPELAPQKLVRQEQHWQKIP